MDQAVESQALYVRASGTWSLAPAIVLFGALVFATSLFALAAAFTLGAALPMALGAAIAAADAMAGIGLMLRRERARQLFVGCGAIALALVAVAAIALGGSEPRRAPARPDVTRGAASVRAQLSEIGTPAAKGGAATLGGTLAHRDAATAGGSVQPAALTGALLVALALVGGELWFFTRAPVVRAFAAGPRDP